MNLGPLPTILLLLLLPFVAFHSASSPSGPENNDGHNNRDGASTSTANVPIGDGASISSSSSIVPSNIGGGPHCQWKEGMLPQPHVFMDNRTHPPTKFKLLLSKKPIGQGTYGKVFHTHYMEENPVKDCVALKVIMDENNWDIFDNEIRVLKEFAQLDNEEHRRHVVKLYQYGQIGDHEAYIMELGEKSLADYFKKNGADLNEGKIKKIAKEIAQAMRDFHRVAMHLDLKPENMMYFGGPNNSKVLKAIDFGPSKLLKEAIHELPSETRKSRANICHRVKEAVTTLRYDGPENNYKNVCNLDVIWEESAERTADHNLLSPKTDIWSIGIMIYEAILWSSHTKLEFFYKLRGEKIPIWKILTELNNVYKNDKETWIRRRGKAIREEEIQKKWEINEAKKAEEQREREKEEAHETEQHKRSDIKKGKKKQIEVDPDEAKEQQKHIQRNKDQQNTKGIRIEEQQKTDEQIEKISGPNKEEAVPEIEEEKESSPNEEEEAVPEIDEGSRSRLNYAAYVYLVLQVQLEHSFLYKIINSCLERKPVERPSAMAVLDYLDLDGKCTLKRTREDSGPILLDTETIEIFKYYLGEPNWIVNFIKHFRPQIKPGKYLNLRTFFLNAKGNDGIKKRVRFASAPGCDPNPKCENVCHFEGMTPSGFPQRFVAEEANGHNGKELDILLSTMPIGKGTFGYVYHVHLKSLADLEAVECEHCVALKEARTEETAWALKNEIEILKEFAKLENQHRQHVVRMYQAGQLHRHVWSAEGKIIHTSSQKTAYLMEMGKMSLGDYFANNFDNFTEAGLREVAKDIALAMRDFHRVAMHLELRPENMMYFRYSNGEMVLKAIHFDSSKLLKHEDRKLSSYKPEFRANFCKIISNYIGSLRYDSPEINHVNLCINNSWESAERTLDHIVLTPKADIWSIGIMIFETILWSSETDKDFFYELRGEKIDLEKNLTELNNFYKYDKKTWIRKRVKAIRREIEKQKKEENDKAKKPEQSGVAVDKRKKGGENRVYPSEKEIEKKSRRDYAAYVYLVLKVHLEHPFLYQLINSCLELTPEHRPSAVGIVEYLKEKCTMESIKADSTPILLDQEAIKIIEKKWEKPNFIRRIFTKPKKPEVHAEEVKKLKKFFERIKRKNFDLRSFINVTAGQQQHSDWCDTRTSELPTYKNRGTAVLTPADPADQLQQEDIVRAEASSHRANTN